MWPLTYFVTLAVCLAWHLHWKRRAERLREEISASKTRAEAQAADLLSEMDLLRSRQDMLFNSMTDGVILVDGADKVQFANAAVGSLCDIDHATLGRPLIEFTRRHEIVELAARVRERGAQVSEDIEMGKADGRVIQVNGVVVAEPAKLKGGVLLVFHDNTQLKKLERTRKEFVANVSHELRTPLSLITGYVETLLNGAKDDPAVALRFLRTIEKNANRLTYLIEDLLAISELESGRAFLNPQPVSLRHVIDKVLEDLAGKSKERQITIKVELPESSTVHADADRLEQVFVNLVENAIKYGRERGTIVVRAAITEDGCMRVSVSDDGQGIPEASIGRVFERFYRVDNDRSREQGGTGLGLSIVKHIIRAHGGDVWAESQLGKGAVFYFTLPLSAHTEKSNSTNTHHD